MAKRMLIDATHPEETRVVVLSGNRLEDFDFETSTKKQLKGNIYLAKVTRVEPSLQAAFVDYGGNRHGFLAFSEIHPDYYQIPVADRERLLAEMAKIERGESGGNGREDRGGRNERRGRRGGGRNEGRGRRGPDAEAESPNEGDAGANLALPLDVVADQGASVAETQSTEMPAAETPAGEDGTAIAASAAADPATAVPERDGSAGAIAESVGTTAPVLYESEGTSAEAEENGALASSSSGNEQHADAQSEPPRPESAGESQSDGMGSDDNEELARRRQRLLRNYKIQEVIKRRQILLVQVVKEERGTKGAALTTYLSLAGRYCVLMPNTARGGGVSRKITNAPDRKRLKSMIDELDLPEGMGLIVRTAGSERTKIEVKRDCDYLIRLWDSIRETTLTSTAPCLIHAEADLIKRSIRDLYARDIEEVLVDGEDQYKAAKDFMKMLMPSHAKRVQRYKDGAVPLFQRFQVEAQLDAMHSPMVSLRSGGSIVINQTEALVAIDVNSGRATRERHIEDTALKTNLEAADEVARQLRLRDLAGLIVIDFIDMEDGRHNHQVERRLKDAMRVDRARIQIGRISAFGLLELSRQRLRPSLVEASTTICPHCGGSGHIRSTESTSLHVLRAVEEEGAKRRAAELSVYVPTDVALYILNHKRAALADIETRHDMKVFLLHDDTLIPPNHRIERTKVRDAQAAQIEPRVQQAALPPPIPRTDDDDDEEAEDTEDGETQAARPQTHQRSVEGGAYRGESGAQGENGEERGGRRRRRRRRRRGGGDRQGPPGEAGSETSGRIGGLPQGSEGGHEPRHADDEEPSGGGEVSGAGSEAADAHGAGIPGAGGRANGYGEGEEGEGGRRRRRGRRGGRRRGRREEGEGAVGGEAATPYAPRPDVVPHADFEPRPEFVTPPAPPVVTPPPAYQPPYRPTSVADQVLSAFEQLETQERPASAAEPPAVPVDPNPPVQVIGGDAVITPRRGGWWQRK